MFEWGPPPIGNGPEFVVDSYRLLVTDDTAVWDSVNLSASSRSWNVTLDYNEEYRASIASINCVGESSLISLHNILFGKFISPGLIYK